MVETRLRRPLQGVDHHRRPGLQEGPEAEQLLQRPVPPRVQGMVGAALYVELPKAKAKGKRFGVVLVSIRIRRSIIGRLHIYYFY